jgi:hypothetical protein
VFGSDELAFVQNHWFQVRPDAKHRPGESYVALKSYRDFEKVISPLLKNLKPQGRVIGFLSANLTLGLLQGCP